MKTQPSPLSLPELRRRTDRDLVVLAARELDRSVRLTGSGEIAGAEASWRQAKLLLRLAGAPAAQISEMETRLGHARAALDRRRAAPRACGASC